MAFSDFSATLLLDALNEAALVVDANNVFVYANPAFYRWAELSVGTDLTGKSLADLLAYAPEPTRPNVSNSAIVLQEGFRLYRFEQPLEANSPKSTTTPLETPSLTQAHTDFISTVSHEFRTPLTSIKGFADTLLQYSGQLPETEKQRFVSIIKDQADRLIRLVENLLTVSTLGPDGPQKVDLSHRSVPLQKLIDKVVQGIQAKLRAKGSLARQFNVTIHPASLVVWGDPDRLEQILINLVDNAAKYSPAQAPVYIQACFVPNDDSQVQIIVRDEGDGIPEELLPRIFTKFYRVKSPLQQEVEGTGLGLYIAQSLTQAMGGQIRAESLPGQGSSFIVTLPAATPERQALHQKRMAARDA